MYQLQRYSNNLYLIHPAVEMQQHAASWGICWAASSSVKALFGGMLTQQITMTLNQPHIKLVHEWKNQDTLSQKLL